MGKVISSWENRSKPSSGDLTLIDTYSKQKTGAHIVVFGCLYENFSENRDYNFYLIILIIYHMIRLHMAFILPNFY